MPADNYALGPLLMRCKDRKKKGIALLFCTTTLQFYVTDKWKKIKMQCVKRYMYPSVTEVIPSWECNVCWRRKNYVRKECRWKWTTRVQSRQSLTSDSFSISRQKVLLTSLHSFSLFKDSNNRNHWRTEFPVSSLLDKHTRETNVDSAASKVTQWESNCE